MGATSPGNITSLRAFRRFADYERLCRTVRVSLFGGLIVWHTPWRKVEGALGKLTHGNSKQVSRKQRADSRR